MEMKQSLSSQKECLAGNGASWSNLSWPKIISKKLERHNKKRAD